ncbi:hypothetical protein BJY52DRAFT_1186514 [Lactarius psammicola]|nr:hypothetical protein BJY52DRAFT_1186514 [Lactarius psammicola]
MAISVPHRLGTIVRMELAVQTKISFDPSSESVRALLHSLLPSAQSDLTQTPQHLFRDLLVSFEMGTASAASGYFILYYDYFLTLSREVDGFWHPGPHTWASIVFFANRYIALLGHVPFLYIVYADPCKTVVGPIHLFSDDDSFSYFQAHTAFSRKVPWHIDVTSSFSDRGVYALYFRNKWVLAFVALEAVVAIGYSLNRQEVPAQTYKRGESLLLPEFVTRHQCHSITSIMNTRSQTAAAFSGLLVFDFTVFALSTYRSIKLGRHNEPFLKRLFVDGLVYYGVTWSANLVNVIVLVTTDPSVDLATPVFANVLSVIMISRLMINLHDPMLHNSTVRDDTDETDVSLTGYISTSVPDGILFALASQAGSSMELSTLDLRQENAPGSISQ